MSKRILPALMALVVSPSLIAQSVGFLIVEKVQNYTQTDNSTTTLVNWDFRANVEAADDSDISGIATPTLSLPGGSGPTTMVYEMQYNAWEVEADVDASFTDQASLDAAYFSGNYTLTALGQTISPIDLSGDSYPGTAPIATLSSGTIVSGILTWDPSQALTISISGIGLDHMGLFISGTSYNDDFEGFGIDSASLTIPAYSLMSGTSYDVELSFDDIVGGVALYEITTGPLAGAVYAGIYSLQTRFVIQTISAVPEPGTYSMICGGLVLLATGIARRFRGAAGGSTKGPAKALELQ